MHKKIFVCALLISALCISACGSSNKADISASNNVVANASYGITETQVEFKAAAFDNAKLNEFYPIMRDGKTVALIRLNQIERLGIFDWTSAESVDAGIKHSYTLNFTIRYLGSLHNGENKTFHVLPELRNDNSVVGQSCIVGWSGFPQTAVFNKDTNEAYLEYGVQPFKKITKKTVLAVKITDDDGIKYDDVLFSKSIFKKVVKGPGLHTDDKAASVKGASGAKYTINVYDVNYADVYNKPYALNDIDDKVELPVSQALTFKYRVAYLSEPTKNLEVSNVDTSKKNGSMLLTDLTIAVQGNSDNVQYNEHNKDLYWFVYSNKVDMTRAYSTKHYKIHKGTYAYYTDNRKVPDAFIASSKRIRFSVELSSDALAMTPQQLMKFSGRFLVFERAPKVRELPKKTKNSSIPYISYTSDKGHE